MSPMFDAFWRAAAYCLRPKVILLSFLPLIVMLVGMLAWGQYLWEPTLEMVRQLLSSTETMRQIWAWSARMGLGGAQTVMAHLLVIFTVTPLIVMASLVLVTLLMAPMVVKMVARRRFPSLKVSGDAGFVKSLLWSLAALGIALVALIVSMPLWLIPPLVLVLPPLVWGWLTYRVMAFDALATHASTEERKQLFQTHRHRLLAMGVFCGYLGGAPGLLWLSGPVVATMFPLLLPLTVWVYTLVFVFSSLWFAHYCLAALNTLRKQEVVVDAVVEEVALRKLLEP